MKKQTLSLAVASALLVGGSGAFADMHVNDRGLGEALIYPFFSSAGGNDTYVHVVNTTEYVKAVKVRFIEAQNSQEVLDFNLYLSPEDEWAGTITMNPNGTGAVIRTVDNSCTVPELGTAGGANVGELAGTTTTRADGKIQRDQPFVPFNYLDDSDLNSNADVSIERTREGYIEIIEMGQLSPTDGGKGEATVHNADGVPKNCGALVAAWSSQTTGNETTEGDWLEDPEDELLSTWEGGGLYGYGVLINVPAGASAGYDASAIDAFYDGQLLHFPPGEENPSLNDASSFVTIFDGTDATNYAFDSGEDAVSALYMTDGIANDYVIDPDINALTDWVVTMPTKKFYVNPGPTAVAPFSTAWNGVGACEPVAIAHWDREEAFVPPPTSEDGPVFSPQPPTDIVDPEDFNICTEVSIITYGAESALSATDSIRYGFAPDYNDGWAFLSFDPDDLNDPGSLEPDARELEADDGSIFVGLPAIGFAVFNYQNGDPNGDGVLANYATTIEHKTTATTVVD